MDAWMMFERKTSERWKPRSSKSTAVWSRKNSDLYTAVKEGDRKALNRLIDENEPMIRKIASRYIHLGFTPDELVQEGRCGYLTGINRYEEGRGTSVNTYASWWAWSAIKQYVNNEIKRSRRFSSYDHLTDPSSDRYFGSRDIEDPDGFRRPSEELLLSFWQEVEILRQRIRALPKRQAFILCRRYGFDDTEGPCTLQEVGDELSVTRECIRQICVRGLKKLRVTEARFFQVAEALQTFSSMD